MSRSALFVFCFHQDGREHTGLKQTASIVDGDPRFFGSCLFIHHIGDVGYFPFECLVRKCRNRHFRPGSDPETGHVFFINIDNHPERREIGHQKERFVGIDNLSLRNCLFNHDPAYRGGDRNKGMNISIAFGCGELRNINTNAAGNVPGQS